LQFQQTLILASYLTQNGVKVSNLAGAKNQQAAQNALSKLVGIAPRSMTQAE